ncbi:MAG: hypothetical protein VKP57_13495, partial [Candidatus Sericytochromatia bacterium]|nr:hypothetical protein [Candidatus Sericytochromatia bacterium]
FNPGVLVRSEVPPLLKRILDFLSQWLGLAGQNWEESDTILVTIDDAKLKRCFDRKLRGMRLT